MKYLITSILLICSFAATGQSQDPGFFPPSYIGWADDTTKFGVLMMDTVTKKGIWGTLNPDHFVFDGTELSMVTATDSVFVQGDSLCAINNGDTLCVYQDSVFITNDSFCIIQMGDTTCVTYSGGVGATTIYNGNGSLSANRVVSLNNKTLSFDWGANGLMRFAQEGLYPMITMEAQNTFGNSAPILELSTTSNNDSYFRYNGDVGEDYSLGVDKSANAFLISEGTNVETTPMMSFYGEGDSIVVAKDLQINAGLLDGGGDIGASTQLLSSTGTETNWISQSTLTPYISSLFAALGTNTINNANYAQEWQWNSLAGGSGLKLSSTSTAAIGSTQKLFEVALSGANATASQSTYAAYLSNSHTGSGHINYGLYSTITGGSTSSAAIYGNVSSSTGNGVVGNALSGYGVYGASSGNSGVYGYSANTSVNRHALHGEKNTSNNANPEHILGLYAQTSGTATTGFGASIEFYAENASGGSAVFSNEIETEWTDATAGSVDSRMTISGAENSTQTDIIYFEGDKRTRFNGRAQMTQGIDVASVAGAITLGSDGNVFEITGTNAITLISNVAWQNGSEITLLFTSTASLTDGVANSGTNIGMELSGNANFTGSADDSVTLVLSEIGGTQRWREKCRSIN